MSDDYVETDNETTQNLFGKRMVYDFDSKNPNYKNLVDFNFGEKFLYGRVSRNFLPIYIEDKNNLKTFQSSITDGPPLQAVNFVVDMFSRLSTQFEKCVQIGKIKDDDPFLSSLRVFKAFEDPVELHGTYLQNYFNLISRDLSKTKYANLEEFMFLLENRLKGTLNLYPITFAGFVKKRVCPISTSGLAIEIADADYFNDNKKIEEFINSPNWEFYLNACRSYGFMIDKLIPWRLVADIGSSECIEYSLRYDLDNTNLILRNVYERTDLVFFNKLKFYLLNLYNQNVGTYVETYQCEKGVRVKYKTIAQSNIEKFDSIFPEKKLLLFYMKLRMYEEDKRLNAGQQKKLIKDILDLYSINGLSVALNSFETIINQPFDSPGSLSYINQRFKKNYEG